MRNSGEKVTNEWRCRRRLVINHTVRGIDTATRTAYCRGCEQVVPIIKSAKTHKGWKCANKSARDRNESAIRNKERSAPSSVLTEEQKEKRRQERRLKKYNLTSEQYDEMEQVQAGLCAICKKPPSGKAHDKYLAIDHDHATGKVRALLCHRCNLGLGCFNDDIDLFKAAIEYVNSHV